jgi:archaellum biogenesis protein FlaJ (TadC family)
VAALLAYTISNALAPKFAKGGHLFLIATFGSITCIMTGFNMLVVPIVAGRILLEGVA